MDKPCAVDKTKPPARTITSATLLLAVDHEARISLDDFDDEEITQRVSRSELRRG